MDRLMKISILKCGPGIDVIKAKHGHASDWVTEIIQAYDKNIELSVIDSYKCIMPEVNDDAWIITGSSSSCYEDKDWIVELEILIRKGYKEKLSIKLKYKEHKKFSIPIY